MCTFKGIHFIFETSKMVEKRKNKTIDYDANQNLILIKYLIHLKLGNIYFQFEKKLKLTRNGEDSTNSNSATDNNLNSC